MSAWRLRDALAVPLAYELLQGFFGYRARFAREFVCARPGDRVLGIGCGPARLLDYLPNGVQYTGFDMSERYIAAARRRYGDRGTFVHAMLGEESLEIGTYDIVLAVGVLHHLDDAGAGQLMCAAQRYLQPHGRMITLDPAYQAGQKRAARWFAAHDRGAYVRHVEAYEGLAKAHFGCVTTKVVTDLYRVPYTICIMECRRGHDE